MTAPARDRRAALADAGRNGIDFVEIANAEQTILNVHFINGIAIDAFSAPARITGGETIAEVPVLPFPASGPPWSVDEGHLVLTLTVAAPGDFSNYTLSLAAPALDPFFATIVFSFKAGCPADVDCAIAPPACPPVSAPGPRIDYLGRDFLSFRQALLDYSTQYYPDWQERSEADFGMMFAEALSALGDEFSYLQDRIAGEASLVTASERRSVTRHARLVDYEPGRAIAASVMLQFEVGATATAPAGIAVRASGDDGTAIVFETGGGLNAPPPAAPLDPRWNRAAGIKGYWFDDSARCLPAGATAMTVEGQGYAFQAGQTLLIETAAENALDPPQRQLVQLLGFGDTAGPWAVERVDSVFPGGGRPITTIAWRSADALHAARDLAVTQVIGNIVPATQGETLSDTFDIASDTLPAPGAPPLAIERDGPSPTGSDADRPVVRLHTLLNAPLAWLPAGDGSARALPEIHLVSSDGDWNWNQSLIEARATDLVFTLDPAAYRPLPANSDGTVASEYDGAGGDTIRFGDGTLGANPLPGRRFTAIYRMGAGAAGNVAVGAVNQIAPGTTAAANYLAVTNPFAATGGADAETLLSVVRNAPQAFRANQPRVVTADDYVAAATALPWVKRAGYAQRWTGSWLTTFATPQPANSDAVLPAERLQLVERLGRMRMAGVECYVPDPQYVSIDLRVTLCATQGAFAAQVAQAVTAALSPGGAPSGEAFFAIGRFGFGDPLYRGDLEAAIQAVSGVAGVNRITYRLRDRWLDFQDMGASVAVGAAQILRCENDRSRPAAGALAVTVEGGR